MFSQTLLRRRLPEIFGRRWVGKHCNLGVDLRLSVVSEESNKSLQYVKLAYLWSENLEKKL